MSGEKQNAEIYKSMCEELFNNLEKQYQEVFKVKAESEQIEKMAQDFYSLIPDYDVNERDCRNAAKGMYAKGYRKQIEGEWIEQIKTTTNVKGMTAHYIINFCSNCGYKIGAIRYRHKYCPNCGAKMKG